MTLDFAQRCAEKLVPWIAGHAERVDVAGSVRRRRPTVNDLDLVVVPKLAEVKDIFGVVTTRTNATLGEVLRRAEAEKWKVLRSGSEITSVVAKGVQVDIFWTTPERWGTVLLQRTGSARHNIWLAEQAKAQGAKWHPNLGLYQNHMVTALTEEGIYAALGLPFLDPVTQRDDERFASLRPRTTAP